MRNDYPIAASEEAQKALDHRAEFGSECGTAVGWARAQQLADREEISDEVILRTRSFLQRAAVYNTGEFMNPDGTEVCGSVMYAAWGGQPMLKWTDDVIAEIARTKSQEARPYPNEHAARIEDPAEYVSFARVNDFFGEGIDAIFGIEEDGDTELQAIRFDADRFTVEQAEAWLAEYGFTPILFEPAMQEAQERAEPNELAVGDFVKWDSGNGQAQGRIIEIATEGELAADSGFTVEGTPDDPAAKVRIYDYDSELQLYVEREPSLNVVHRFSTLEPFGAEFRKNGAIKEKRALGEMYVTSERTICGYAAVYGSPSEDLGGFIEYIEKGAFDEVLGDDCRALFNHDANLLLARTASGTLKLKVDDRGLYYEFEAPHTTAGNDLLELLKRGDVTQSSFGFTIKEDEWVMRNGITYRYIKKVARLYDVSPVTYPAYPATSAALKASGALRASEGPATSQEAPAQAVDLTAYRLRLIKTQL